MRPFSETKTSLVLVTASDEGLEGGQLHDLEQYKCYILIYRYLATLKHLENLSEMTCQA